MAIAEKICTGCGKTLPATQEYFAPHKLGKMGLAPKCRECMRELNRKYWRNGGAEKHKARRKENVEQHRMTTAAYRERTKERRAAQVKAYAEANAEAIKAYQEKWRDDNTEALRRYDAEYREAHREKLRAYNQRWRKARRESDPVFVLNQRMSHQIRQALLCKKERQRWEALVGYTVRDLRERLESCFTEGMGWDNMSEWHIDHIRPKTSFTYTTTADPAFKECWSLTNLQPLWAHDNLTKSAKWCGESACSRHDSGGT